MWRNTFLGINHVFSYFLLFPSRKFWLHFDLLLLYFSINPWNIIEDGTGERIHVPYSNSVSASSGKCRPWPVAQCEKLKPVFSEHRTLVQASQLSTPSLTVSEDEPCSVKFEGTAQSRFRFSVQIGVTSGVFESVHAATQHMSWHIRTTYATCVTCCVHRIFHTMYLQS